jgi:hypothetical protein
MRLNTVRLFAVLTTEKVLSNVWWTFTSTDTDADTDDAEKALVLWLNSTPGLLLVLAHREETEGAWVKFKKPVLEGMPVLDVRKIRTRRRAKLAYAYDKLAQRGLKSLPNLETDEVRASIDEAVADALELPDFSILRELLAREPIICCSNDRLMPGGEAYRG